MHNYFIQVLSAWLENPFKYVTYKTFKEAFTEEHVMENMNWYYKTYNDRIKVCTIASLQIEMIMLTPEILWVLRYMLVYFKKASFLNFSSSFVLTDMRCTVINSLAPVCVLAGSTAAKLYPSREYKVFITSLVTFSIAYVSYLALYNFQDWLWPLFKDEFLTDDDDPNRGLKIREHYFNELKYLPFDCFLSAQTLQDGRLLTAGHRFKVYLTALMVYGAALSINFTFGLDNSLVNTAYISIACGLYIVYRYHNADFNSQYSFDEELSRHQTMWRVLATALAGIVNASFYQFYNDPGVNDGLIAMSLVVRASQRLTGDLIYNLASQADVLLVPSLRGNSWFSQDNIAFLLMHTSFILLISRFGFFIIAYGLHNIHHFTGNFLTEVFGLDLAPLILTFLYMYYHNSVNILDYWMIYHRNVIGNMILNVAFIAIAFVSHWLCDIYIVQGGFLVGNKIVSLKVTVGILLCVLKLGAMKTALLTDKDAIDYRIIKKMA